MYRTLFDVAGWAMVGWLLLILLPRWRVSRWLAETAAFPVFLCVLYLIGIVRVFGDTGPGIMADFGSADGVLGLLRSEPVALVAWIHILAFDQLVGLLIYRDNMRYRFVPLPVQSLLLFATLMLGPLGFLTYYAVRTTRSRTLVAWGEREPIPPAKPAREPAPAPHFSSVATGSTVLNTVTRLLLRNRALVGLGVLGFVLAGITSTVAAVNGGWLLAPEGRLLEAAKFDVAVGIYVLTLALLLPLAPFGERGRRRWVAWSVGLGVFGYAVENVQAWRGLDPRFSQVAGPADQIIGGLFFLSAVGLLVLFAVLISRFFSARALPDHPTLRIALLYAAGSAFLAFGVGIGMSVLNGRMIAGAGNLMPVHAAGFHALQAVPLVALLAGTSPLLERAAERWVHFAGAGWLALCLGLLLQALTGVAPLQPTPALVLVVAGALAWATALGYAGRARWGVAPRLA